MLTYYLALFGYSVLSAKHPGIRTSIDVTCIDHQMHEVLPVVLQNMSLITIPDTSYWVLMTLFPTRLKMSNFKIHHLSLIPDSSDLVSDPSKNGIALILNGLDLDLSADYSFSFPFSSEGYFNMTISNATIKLPVILGVTNSLQFSAHVESIEFNYHSLSLEVTPTSESSAFSNMEKFFPKKKIKDHVVRSVFKSLPEHLNKRLSNYLKAYKYSYQIGELPIYSNYEVFALNVGTKDLQAEFNGTFFLNNKPEAKSPGVPKRVPEFNLTSPFKAQLSEYLFKSYTWAMYTSQALKVYINGSNVPANFPYPFTTTGFSKIAPEITSVYGRNRRIDMECKVYDTPDIQLQKTFEFSADINCNFLVDHRKELVNVFTVLMKFKSIVYASLVNQEGKILMVPAFDRTQATFEGVKVINSRVGLVNIDKIASAFNWYGYYLVNAANSQLLNDGILLPFPRGLSYKNEKISVYPGAVEIGFEPIFIR